jgi:hypothetical protein
MRAIQDAEATGTEIELRDGAFLEQILHTGPMHFKSAEL